MLWISLAEAVYVIYMMNYFETTTNFAHPLTQFDWEYIRHPVQQLSEPQNLVCPFGHTMSWILAAYLLLREMARLPSWFNTIVLCVAAIMSLMNFNVTVYFLPLFLVEICIAYAPTTPATLTK
jgi:hypothetical protein